MDKILHLIRPLGNADYTHIIIARTRQDALEKAEDIVEHTDAQNVTVIGVKSLNKGENHLVRMSFIHLIYPGISYAELSWAWLALAEGFWQRDFVDCSSRIIDQVADAINEDLIQ
ncbi:hypothetical protein LCGC14_1104150 [marine sediment metagenome]|uniref:Uncharacterized protein n=1 Tax=marine sediment metagenome TaxID=412755 RepID=A0A0F9QEW3_9ZZZZ